MKLSAIKKISIFLAMAAMTCSCSKALLFDKGVNELNGNEGRLIIKGVITDNIQFKPLKGIQVSFQCSQENFEKMTTYTDDNGIYTIIASGFTYNITGCVTVKDPEDIYSQATREITVNWTGEAFDSVTSTFILNDCNFQLQKKN